MTIIMYISLDVCFLFPQSVPSHLYKTSWCQCIHEDVAPGVLQ